jgi:hypothetical protein
VNLRATRHFFDALALAAAALALALVILADSSILFDYHEPKTIEAITALESALTGALGSISGMLIASFLISTQVSGHRPYSRLTASFRGAMSWYPFLYLFLSIIISVAILIALPRMEPGDLAYVDASVVVAAGTVFALVSLMLNSFAVFTARSAGAAALRGYTARAVKKYHLLDVGLNADGSVASYRLRGWGHRHNLADPLGPFHDLIMEAIADRQRITLHLYLSCLMRRVAYLNGVRFRRSFGLQEIGDFRSKWDHSFALLAALRRPTAGSAATRVQVTAHALHYLVRRSKKLITEWELDNHRQIFTIILADLILSLRQRRDSSPMINLCIDAILRIGLDYKDVRPHGSYEPTHELFKVAVLLHRTGHYGPYNYLIAALAYIDRETPYLSRSPLTDWQATASQLPAGVLASFAEAAKQLEGLSLAEAFPGSLWH